MDYDSLLELVKNRRSIRSFKPDPIPDEYVDKIIEAARWAPSGFNSQPWEFVVVRKQELKDSIVQIMKDNLPPPPRREPKSEPSQGPPPRPPGPGGPMGFTKAPVFILLFGDTRVKDFGPMPLRFDEERWKSVLTSTLACAFQYMHMATTTLGLASQWVSAVTHPMVHSQLKQLLGIPKELEVYDMMAVGYPAMEPIPKLMRAREEMVHYDYCGEDDFRTDEEVKDFFYRSRNPGSVPPGAGQNK